MTATRLVTALARLTLVVGIVFLLAVHRSWHAEVWLMFWLVFLAVCLVGADLDQLRQQIQRGVDIHVKVDESDPREGMLG